jgi:hypothetical protein
MYQPEQTRDRCARIPTKWRKRRIYLDGSGHALTTHGTAYITESTLPGDGDIIIRYGSVFRNRTTIITAGGPVSWARTPKSIQGSVLIDCRIISERGKSTLARLPDNTGRVAPNWQYAEMVLLNTQLVGVARYSLLY